MKVAILCRAYPPDIGGGGELSTQLLAEGLVDAGLEVDVLTFGDGSARPPAGRPDDPPVHRYDPPSPYWSLRCRVQPRWKRALWHARQLVGPPPADLARWLGRRRPDVVHTSTVEDWGLGCWSTIRGLGLPVVHTLRSFNLLHHHATLYDGRRDRPIPPDAATRWRRRRSLSLCGVVALSRSTLEEHTRRGFFRNIPRAVIGNPSGLDFVPRGSAVGETDESGGEVRIGFLGRLSWEKGVAQLCRAAVDLHSNDQLRRRRTTSAATPWRLSFAGTGDPDLESLIDDAARRSPIHRLGHRDPRRFLSDLDALIVPSRWAEPFGRIIVEAQSLGVPVACTNRGGMPELVDAGVNGWVFDSIDADALARVRDECRSFAADDVARSVSRFSVGSIARRYRDFYGEVIDGFRRREPRCRRAA